MRVKRNMPTLSRGPQGPSTSDEGGNRCSSTGGTQPPSVAHSGCHVEVPVGALVVYLGGGIAEDFGAVPRPVGLVLDRSGFHRDEVLGQQPNPDIFPVQIPMLFIQWLNFPVITEEHFRMRLPRMWVEIKGGIYPLWQVNKMCNHSDPVWVQERDYPEKTGKTLWELLE